MILPARNTYLCEVVLRQRKLPSGLWLADKIKHEKKDNVARCLGAGEGAKLCKRDYIVHYKENFGKKFDYDDKHLITLRDEEIIAVEVGGKAQAVGSMVIVRLHRKDRIGSIILSEGAKLIDGEFYGEVVSVGPDYPDKSLRSGDKILFRWNEGYRFRTYEGRESLLAVKEKWIGGKYENV